jgi:hypothetical protein
MGDAWMSVAVKVKGADNGTLDCLSFETDSFHNVDYRIGGHHALQVMGIDV